MNEPLWISEEIVRVIHQDQIQQHGGSLGIRDENLQAASLAFDPPKSPLLRGTLNSCSPLIKGG